MAIAYFGFRIPEARLNKQTLHRLNQHLYRRPRRIRNLSHPEVERGWKLRDVQRRVSTYSASPTNPGASAPASATSIRLMNGEGKDKRKCRLRASPLIVFRARIVLSVRHASRALLKLPPSFQRSAGTRKGLPLLFRRSVLPRLKQKHTCCILMRYSSIACRKCRYLQPISTDLGAAMEIRELLRRRTSFLAVSASQKLSAGTRLLTILLFAVSGISFLCSWTLQSTFDRAINHQSRNVIRAGDLSRATSEIMMGQTQYVMYTLQNDPDSSETARKSVHASAERAATWRPNYPPRLRTRTNGR